MKILILILSSVNGSYSNIIQTVKNTWYQRNVDDVRKIFYFGNSNRNELIGDELFLTIGEDYYLMGPRTLSAFEYTQNLDYDYVFRVNAGSYIHQENLVKFLQNKPRTNFYSGIVGNYMGVEYASGSGYILSKNLVNRLINDKHTIRIQFPTGELCVDDTAIGEMVSRYGVKVDRSAMRISYISNSPTHQETEMQIGDSQVPFISQDDNYHYRLRSYDRNIDIQRMVDLHKKIYG